MKEPEIGSFIAILFLSFFSLAILLFAKRKGFFRLPEKKIEKGLTWMTLLSLFASVILLIFGAIPLVFLLLRVFFPLGIVEVVKDFSQNGIVIVLAIWILIYLSLVPATVRSYILFRHRIPTVSNQSKSAVQGFIAFLLAYPASLVVTAVITLIIVKIFGEHPVDQVAVDYLKNTAKNLGHFLFTFLLVVFVVPFVEEFFFRGVLQNWLKKFLPQFGAIILASLIFAAFHFSKSQGVGNIELLCTLFFLSCFLGFIYEKEGQLISSYVFHASYNALNAIMVYIEVFQK